MRTILKIALIGLGISLLWSSCVSQKKYKGMVSARDYWEGEALGIDSIQNIARALFKENRDIEADLRQSYHQLEQLTVTNQSLKKSYDDLLQRYNGTISNNQNVITNTSLENQSLRERLAAQQAALDQKERTLNNLEYELRQREARLNQVQSNFSNIQGEVASKEARIQELNRLLEIQKNRTNTIINNIRNVLSKYTSDDLTVTQQNGKIYISLSQNLLFPKNSDQIDWKGRVAINQLAEVLKQNTDLEILVEGHTDNDGSASHNWELSTKRAIAVVEQLQKNNINTANIIAAGRAFYAPIAPNNTEANKAKNRRVEIILYPKIDAFLDAVNP